jgi:oxygen-independent coproporphyrinogen-3 oxidase
MAQAAEQMLEFNFEGVKNPNEYIELIKMFLRPSEFRVSDGGTGVSPPEALLSGGDKNAVKRFLFDYLVSACGLAERKPEWGILTGVRPVKLFGELAAAKGRDAALALMKDAYYLSDKKIELVSRVCGFQREHTAPPPQGSVGLYIGIPFCPTRCEYCSFPSNQSPYSEIEAYLEALNKEILFVSTEMEKKGLFAETIYIGGGTPTTLCEQDLDALLELVNTCFKTEGLSEFTVEAGRPDTLTDGKLDSMKRRGVKRISINPQSMNEETLAAIGRDHSAGDVVQAFRIARQAGIPVINTDLIAGLPGEDATGFERSLGEIIELGADNITIHTLAVKRAARLKENDAEYNYNRAGDAALMLETAGRELDKAGYEPYYLYRQKQTAGNLENTGYAKDGRFCLYNIRIMEENQTIIALGAGASSKAYFPEENRLERVFNVSNYEIYIQRIQDMLERKKRLLFTPSVQG